MLRKSSVYILLLILIQLLVKINCQETLFKPSKRYLHTATFIGKRLYILGGSSIGENDDIIGGEFFYHDFSDSFNAQSLLWQNLTSVNTVPSHRNAASVNGGANNNTLILYLGSSQIAESPLIYTFDTQNNLWNTPRIIGDNSIIDVKRKNLEGVVDYKGNMYLFGGSVINTVLNDMLIFDTINLNLRKGSSVNNAPAPRKSYGATLLVNNNIIYLGGTNENNDILPLNVIFLYDTINDVWSQKKVEGRIPSSRDSFSAVLGLDGQRIIIFGGYSESKIGPEDTLYVLNLNNFKWERSNPSGHKPVSRFWHKANVIGRYMVVTFGNGYGESDDSDLLLLDINSNDNYKWTKNFDHNIPNIVSSSTPSVTPLATSHVSLSTPSTSSQEQQLSNHKLVVIGTSIGCSIGGIGLAVGIFILYKWNRYKKSHNHSKNEDGNVLVFDGRLSEN